MESWLKFRAPGITTELGLGIGKLVFGALNKIEIVCFFIIVIELTLNFRQKNLLVKSIVFGLMSILILQTFWLLPELTQMIENYKVGIKPTSKYQHLTYVMLEVIKVFLLVVLGIQHLKKFKLN